MAKDTFFNKTPELLLQGRTYNLDQPRIMGILNVNPDSFFDGGRYLNEADFLKQTEKMLNEGADFIDVGGISSRPGANELSEAEELNRILPVIKILIKKFPEIQISVDTFRSGIAKAVLSEGASIINDISAGRWEPEIYDEVAGAKCTMILMHSRNTFKQMHQPSKYDSISKNVIDELEPCIQRAKISGVRSLIADPGFGFSKNIDQNFELLNGLHHLQSLEIPLLAGISRKSMIWKTLDSTPENALNGTSVLNLVCLQKGARILRVHDVKEAKETLLLFEKLNSKS